MSIDLLRAIPGLRFLSRSLLAAAAIASLRPLHAQSDAAADSQTALELQRGRNERVKVHAKTIRYDNRWDLSDLPKYVPQGQASGTLHIWGANYVKDGMLSRYWEQGFREFQPGVAFNWQLDGGDSGTVGLTADLADIGVMPPIKFSEELGFERRHFYSPTELTVMTGSYNVPGWEPPDCIIVHADNPITKISMPQLDGVFGSQRSGGWAKTAWHAEWARGPEGNLRTWGQLGLTGEWADQRIRPYGYTYRYHAMLVFSDKVLKGSDQWNEETHVFTNYIGPDGKWHGEADQVIDAVRGDKYGIGVLLYRDMGPGTKILPLSATAAGPYVPLTIETVRSRAYPLYGDYYFYINHKPGTAYDPKLREFLHYVFSREGQDDVQRDGKFLPLTGDVVRAQLKRIE